MPLRECVWVQAITANGSVGRNGSCRIRDVYESTKALVDVNEKLCRRANNEKLFIYTHVLSGGKSKKE
ncbi:unnamed protein product [Ceratitis capitata]|uniref:(Mediterranean fruit fly) hypothetical protein n=1 Tax=Ceratitis capitata TaxID=7213 RepID=A0A811UWL0_CERCA|nr:unnamed protein product [Ceratitis capitata]